VFLAVLARTGCVAAASRAVAKERKTAYRTRERCPEFAAQWDAALAEFADGIEAEAIRRAVRGVVKFKFYKGQPILHPTLCECDHGKRSHEQGGRCQAAGCSCAQFQGQPYKERDRSDALLALLLKGLKPESYRDSLGLDAAQVDDYIERRIAEMAEARVEARLAQLGIRNGTVPLPPVTAGQENALPDSTSAGPAAGGPAPGQAGQEREPIHPEELPRRPPWLQGELPGNGL
jgi:hypothetical protein